MEATTATVTLLDFAISCLGRIQLAREFERDFAKHQLQLDIMQVRLSRWGEAAGIMVGASTSGTIQARGVPDTRSLDAQALKILQSIQDLFDEAMETAKNDRAQTQKEMQAIAASPAAAASADKQLAHRADSRDESLDPESALTPSKKRIRMSLGKWVKKRMAGVARTTNGLQWAFYKKDTFVQFVEDLSKLITSLEELFPHENRQKLQELSTQECEDISPPNLRALRGYAAECDPYMLGAIAEKLDDERDSGIRITQSYNIGQTTGIQYGDINGVSNGTGNNTNNYWGRN